MNKLITSFFLLLLVFQLVVSAQKELTKDSRTYETLAARAYQAKDYPNFLEYQKKANSLNPNHPRILYNLAIAYTLNGKISDALDALNKLADLKINFTLEKNEDLAPLKDNREFKAILKKFEANNKPIGNAQIAFTVKERGLVAESLAYDTKTKTFYLASVASRKILRINKHHRTSIFADKSVGLWSVFGMKVDDKRSVLWATTTAHKQMPELQIGEVGMSGIFKFDLKSGKVLKKYLIPNQPKAHWLGDLAIAPNGDVYATDSINPTIYIIRKNKNEIEPFLESSNFVSPQGLDFTPDGKFMLMADYSKGVFKINLATKEVFKLSPAPNSVMVGIDGLYYYQNTLLATQNGTNPQRIIRMMLSNDLTKIEKFQVVEANHPMFEDITLGVLSGNQFYFIANSQWESLGEGGKFSSPEKLKDVSVLKVNLNKLWFEVSDQMKKEIH